MAAQVWATIREAIRAIGATIGESGVITQDIGKAMVVNMSSMAETAEHMNVRMEQTENAMNTISLMINGEIKSLNDRLNSLQSMVDSN